MSPPPPPTRPADPAEICDLLLELFAGGTHWLRHRPYDGNGNFCLMGCLRHIQETHRIDRASMDSVTDHLLQALPKPLQRYAADMRSFALVSFNDKATSFKAIRELIVRAREMASASKRQPAIDILKPAETPIHYRVEKVTRTVESHMQAKVLETVH
jgi:hypothetical protein